MYFVLWLDIKHDPTGQRIVKGKIYKDEDMTSYRCFNSFWSSDKWLDLEQILADLKLTWISSLNTYSFHLPAWLIMECIKSDEKSYLHCTH